MHVCKLPECRGCVMKSFTANTALSHTVATNHMWLFFFNVHLFLRKRERETEHERGRGRERGKHRIRSSSRLRAVSTEPDAGLEPTDREIVT